MNNTTPTPPTPTKPGNDTGKLLIGNLYVFVAIILFSLNIPVVKVLIPEWMTANDVSIARLMGGCALFWIASIFVKTQKIDKKDFWRIFAGGGVSLFLFIYLLNVSLKYGNAIDIAILMTMPPVYIILFQILFRHVKPTWFEVVGMLISFGGAVIVIVTGHASEHASDPLLGDLFAIICGIAYMAYLIILEKPTHVYKPISMLRWVFLGASIMCVFIWWKFPEMPLFHQDAGFMPWFWFIFLMAGPSFLAYLLINPAIKLIGSELVSIYQYLMPVFTTIIAVIMGEAKFEWPQGVAIVVILAGMVLTDIGQRKKAKRLAAQNQNK